MLLVALCPRRWVTPGVGTAQGVAQSDQEGAPKPMRSKPRRVVAPAGVAATLMAVLAACGSNNNNSSSAGSTTSAKPANTKVGAAARHGVLTTLGVGRPVAAQRTVQGLQPHVLGGQR